MYALIHSVFCHHVIRNDTTCLQQSTAPSLDGARYFECMMNLAIFFTVTFLSSVWSLPSGQPTPGTSPGSLVGGHTATSAICIKNTGLLSSLSVKPGLPCQRTQKTGETDLWILAASFLCGRGSHQAASMTHPSLSPALDFGFHERLFSVSYALQNLEQSCSTHQT